MVVVRDAEGKDVWSYDTRGADKEWRIQSRNLVVLRRDSEGREYVLASYLLSPGQRVSGESPVGEAPASVGRGEGGGAGRRGERGGGGQGNGRRGAQA